MTSRKGDDRVWRNAAWSLGVPPWPVWSTWPTWFRLNPFRFLNLSVFFPKSVMLCQLGQMGQVGQVGLGGQMGQVGQNLFVNSLLVLFCIFWSLSFPYFHVKTTNSLPVWFCIVWCMSFPPIFTNTMLFSCICWLIDLLHEGVRCVEWGKRVTWIKWSKWQIKRVVFQKGKTGCIENRNVIKKKSCNYSSLKHIASKKYDKHEECHSIKHIVETKEGDEKEGLCSENTESKKEHDRKEELY